MPKDIRSLKDLWHGAKTLSEAYTGDSQPQSLM